MNLYPYIIQRAEKMNPPYRSYEKTGNSSSTFTRFETALNVPGWILDGAQGVVDDENRDPEERRDFEIFVFQLKAAYNQPSEF